MEKFYSIIKNDEFGERLIFTCIDKSKAEKLLNAYKSADVKSRYFLRKTIVNELSNSFEKECQLER